jgi:GTP pyrophosphokinase
VVEVQIRTFNMHEEAELGVCSHWRYKSRDYSIKSDSYEKKIHWLRQILEWQEELGDSTSMASELIGEISQDRIYVFTRDGHVVDLMPDATPLDFAYRVHTEVGNKCRGALVNGQLVSLNSRLETGDQVVILTEPDALPRREWLYEHLGYLKTSRAKAKVQSWFRLRDRAKNIAEGKELLTAEFKHLGINQVAYDSIASALGFDQVEDFYAKIGSGEFSTRQAVEIAQQLGGIVSARDQLDLALGMESDSLSVRVEPSVSGIGDLPFDLGKCCHPVLGDSIVGVLEPGNRVVVHRKDCLAVLSQDMQSMLMEVNWETVQAKTFPVRVVVDAYDRSGLLYDVSSILAADRINMSSVKTETDARNKLVKILFTLEVSSFDQLLGVLEKIEQISNVIEAKRNLEED